jgi:hypothetical protein
MGSNKTGKPKDSSHYTPPELMPIAICAACLGVVLKADPDAKELYDEIVGCCRLSGLQQLFDKLNDEIPEGKDLAKKVINKAGFDYEKPPDLKNAGIPESRRMILGGIDLISDYSEQYKPWILAENLGDVVSEEYF